MAEPASVILLGRDHKEYGACHVETLAEGRTACSISVGSDRASPSLVAKGSEACPNEDALLAMDDGTVCALAVADAHFGDESSRRLIHLLAGALQREGLPPGPAELLLLVSGLRHPETVPPEQPSSETTLAVLVYDREKGRGFLLAYGDSSLVRIGTAGEESLNVKAATYVTAAYPDSLLHGRGQVKHFEGEADQLLVAFTDGIDECHYGSPETSVTDLHRGALYRETGPDPEMFARLLMEMALEGVDGNPGGQDNIALVVART